MARRRATPGSTDEQRAVGVDDNTFLGRLLDQLSAVVEDQTAAVFEQAGVIIPVRSCSMMVTLDLRTDASTADLADALGITHQLATQKLGKLMKLGLVRRQPDPADARRKRVVLTDLGRAQLDRLHGTTPLFERAYAGLFAEIGDLAQTLRSARAALHHRSIAERGAAEGA